VVFEFLKSKGLIFDVKSSYYFYLGFLTSSGSASGSVPICISTSHEGVFDLRFILVHEKSDITSRGSKMSHEAAI